MRAIEVPDLVSKELGVEPIRIFRPASSRAPAKRKAVTRSHTLLTARKPSGRTLAQLASVVAFGGP